MFQDEKKRKKCWFKFKLRITKVNSCEALWVFGSLEMSASDLVLKLPN